MREGIAQGRFHLIHKGHVEYLLAAKERCDFLYIGVSDCDPERAYFSAHYDVLKDTTREPFRSLHDPVFVFTFQERMQMIRHTLLGEGVSADQFAVVPFPIHVPNLLKYYIPQHATMFVTIYDAWGEHKVRLFEQMGYPVDVLWRRTMAERFTTATEVRRRLQQGEAWESLVPEGVAAYLKNSGLSETLRQVG